MRDDGCVRYPLQKRDGSRGRREKLRNCFQKVRRRATCGLGHADLEKSVRMQALGHRRCRMFLLDGSETHDSGKECCRNWYDKSSVPRYGNPY